MSIVNISLIFSKLQTDNKNKSIEIKYLDNDGCNQSSNNQNCSDNTKISM